MAESHLNYMHGTFPSAKSNEHGSHLTMHHSTSSHDPMLRGRTEPHSVDGGGVGTLQVSVGSKGTV